MHLLADTIIIILSVLRPLYFGIGLLCVALGLVGAALPLMPTTIFLITAAWAFSKSSPRFEQWILTHRKFGPAVRSWKQSGSISTHHKRIALMVLWISCVISVAVVWPNITVSVIIFVFGILVSGFLITRPTARCDRPPI